MWNQKSILEGMRTHSNATAFGSPFTPTLMSNTNFVIPLYTDGAVYSILQMQMLNISDTLLWTMWRKIVRLHNLQCGHLLPTMQPHCQHGEWEREQVNLAMLNRARCAPIILSISNKSLQNNQVEVAQCSNLCVAVLAHSCAYLL